MQPPLSRPRILALFPDFDERIVGGVQASGRAAWEALSRGESGAGARLLLYRAEAGDAPTPERPGTVLANSRLRAAWAASRLGEDAELIFFWHLRLLRLRPFIRSQMARSVVFLHGIESWRRFSWLQRRLLSRTDLFLSNSHHTWREFLKFNPEFADKSQRTVALGLGRPSAVHLQPDAEPAVLMLSRLAKSEDYKGHREMIAAWPLVRTRIPSARLWIAGDGSLRPELEKLARSGAASDAIRFWGRVSEETKEDLIGRSRCLALPSRGEGFGLVYLEAMRLGRPCLVGDADAGREVVRPPEAGLAVDPSLPEALAEAVVRLITPGSEWDRWSLQARQLYESRYTAAHFQRRLLDALELPGGGRTP